MNSSIWFYTMSFRCFMIHIKGLRVKISPKQCTSVPKVFFISTSNLQIKIKCGILQHFDLSLHFSPKYHLGISSLQRINSLLNRVVCWWHWQTAWNKIRPDKWIQTVWHPGGIPEMIFRKSCFWNKISRRQKSMKNYPECKEVMR